MIHLAGRRKLRRALAAIAVQARVRVRVRVRVNRSPRTRDPSQPTARLAGPKRAQLWPKPRDSNLFIGALFLSDADEPTSLVAIERASV